MQRPTKAWRARRERFVYTSLDGLTFEAPRVKRASKIEDVAAILRRLPLLDGTQEEEILDCAQALVVSRVFAARLDRVVSPSARKAIDIAVKRANDLLKAIDALPKEVRVAARLSPQRLDAFASLVVGLCRAQRSIKKRGRRPQLAAEAFTNDAADVWVRLTGLKPTVSTNGGKPSGRFFEYLSALFKTLGIKASPEAQARQSSRVKG